ncbi:hypothetical protein STRDD10_00093 [Streptococcus sp. DD10]|uniref:accessory Sec system protein Asp5 n=1 Tax=Streptococcus sp. DD10 TaxID=1777878 RepID=UPI00079C465C|nr:accessory secretory protein Asp5 [Streptococcus sp. DD10]KXT77136.1 hypothetical protein STRDD10_00093 [Streptococcus sp. DD10]
MTLIEILAILALLISLALIILITIQPRQAQTLGNDTTSNIGQPSYWRSNRIVKVASLFVSIAFFLVTLILMLLQTSNI